ncbi:MAG TPA: trehalose-6-phosphate synthase [Anaeromyxobacteraceae bacterium]|nr:trehalose-6-phosphate synthase [Anaeromyxobacteraceae bacterium]
MTLRVLLPLLGLLAALAWAATVIVNDTTRAWFERDVSMRARLAAGGAREALVAHVLANDRRKLRGVLEEIARDDRITAAAVCGSSMRTLARTAALAEHSSCEAIAGRQVMAATAEATDAFEESDGGLVHTAILPLAEEGRVLARLVIVHDLSYVSRREAAMRRFTAGVFGVVALLASIGTVALGRFSWIGWTRELRRILPPALGGRSPRAVADSKLFAPLLSDLRSAMAELASEQRTSLGGRWTPERLHRTLTQSLEGERVLILANREPYIHDRREDGQVRVVHPASGLVTALEPVMRACSGVWVAHGSGSADREVVDRHDRVLVPPGEESYAIRRVWLGPEEERGYYYGFANEGLWPLCHLVYTRPAFRAEDWRQYHAVNGRFAQAVCDESDGPDPIILVQDYHFSLAPRIVRERLPRATVLAFWHIPWPSAERFGVCPWGRDILEGMLGSSIIGFHTQQHCNNFLECVDRFLEARIDRERMSVVLGGRETLVRAYPISIQWPNGWATAAPPPGECRRRVLAELGLGPDGLVGVGVDRIDYTKGIEERLLAVERALERFPHLRGRFTFAQLGAPSRTLIPEYRDLNDRVDAVTERINRRFADGTWRPIALLRGHHEPPAIFRYLRAADLCYVSSLHDGMNLVAKEFVAARDDERGVLVLSRFTGAARELTEALLVNPYDLEQASAAIATALAMPEAEQAERMRALRSQVADFNVYRWAGRMLTDAARLRKSHRLATRLGAGLHAVEAAP